MKVTVASKSKHWQMWAALRAAGIPIVSTWPDWPHNRDDSSHPEDEEWREHSAKCLSEAAAGELLLLYCEKEERQFGALLEAGSALGAGKPVFLVSPFEWSFLRNHPLVRSFDTLEAAITAIVAMMQGEKARNESELNRKPKLALTGV